jgi:hypothetical protein
MSSKTIVFLTSLFSMLVLTDRTSAQTNTPPAPTINAGDLLPFAGPNVIVGTQFPWKNRRNQVVTTLKQYFTVIATPPVAASAITVKIEGKTATSYSNSPGSTDGYWKYENGSDPIVLGPNSGNKTLSVTFFYGTTQLYVNLSLTYTKDLKLFKVLPQTIPDVDNDFVRETSDHFYNGPNKVEASPGTHDPARLIQNSFTVTGPSGDMTGLRVGIVQTLTTDSRWGNITYTNSVDNTTKGYVQIYPKSTLPWWDGFLPADGGIKPYYFWYSVESWGGLNTSMVGTSWVWDGDTLLLDDIPSTLMPPYPNPTGIPYYWGDLSGTNRWMNLYGAFCKYHVFDPMLTGYSDHVPGVYVPIYGYKMWEVSFHGYLDILPAGVWHLGFVTAGGNSSDKPETDVGPMNSLMGRFPVLP